MGGHHLKRGRAAGAVAAAILIGGVCAAWAVARYRTQQRFADLSACLLGDELRSGESASTRVLAIDLARPAERRREEWTGTKQRIVVDRLPPSERWPDRCAPIASALIEGPAKYTLSAAARGEVARVATAVTDGRAPDNLDALWRETASLQGKRAAAEQVPRPWPALTLLPDTGADVPSPCSAMSLLTTLDRWDDELVILGGKTKCVVTSQDGRRLGSLRPAAASDVQVNADRIERHGSVTSAILAGQTFDAPTGVSFQTCVSGQERAILSTPRDADLELRFVDHAGISDPVRIPLVEPKFEGRGGVRIRRGDPTLSCREKEARVAWAWSTGIDQRGTHEIVTVTCSRAGCELLGERVEVPTAHSTDCGLCAFDLDGGSYEPPIVVDMFGSVALVWNSSETMRARVAPYGELAVATDVVLWHERRGESEQHYWGRPTVLTRGEVALVGVGLRSSGGRERSRIFRLDETGATELIQPGR